MANIRRLMAEVRRLEESGDLQKAIVLQRQALDLQEETTGFADLSLYNGLGDLYLRAGDLRKAVEAFEEAAQHCEDQQLYSNGIAVCKKILRNAPDCVNAYRREGRLLALSGLEAQSLASYRAYIEHLGREGREDEITDALSEFVDLTADDGTALELAARLIEADRGVEALTRLRAVRDKREEQGRDVVALVRRIQELQPRYAPSEGSSGQRTPQVSPRPKADSEASRLARETRQGGGSARAVPGVERAKQALNPGQTVSASETLPPLPPPSSQPTPTASGERLVGGAVRSRVEAHARPHGGGRGQRAEPLEPEAKAGRRVPQSPHPRDPDSDVANLIRELQDVLSRLQGEQRFRHALPIVDHLLEFEPDRFELLHRKLGYAYALGEEDSAIAAYLALGECLDRHLSSFSVRALSTSTPSGSVKTAIKVEERPEAAPTS